VAPTQEAENSTRWLADGGASSTRPVRHAGDSGCGSAPPLRLAPASLQLLQLHDGTKEEQICDERSEIRILNTLSLSII